MADLTLVPMKMCKQLELWEGVVNGYTVRLTERWCTCTCKSFIHRRGLDNYGWCKHIRFADKNLRCYWHEQFMGKPEGKTCPMCGGELVTRMVGV